MAVIPPDSWADMGLDTSGISMTAVPPLVWDNVLKVLAIGSATAAASGVVSIIGQQFSGIKEFMAIPKCALVCSAADDIPNKAYVDTLVKGISWQDEVVEFLDLDSAPPAAPANGDRYIQTVDAGLFTHDRIYEYQDGSWLETIPNEGYAVYVDQGAVFANQSCVYNGTDWVNLGTSIAHASLLGLTNDDHTQYVKVSGRIGDVVTIPNVTASSSTTTGALIVTGGIGCASNVYGAGIRSVMSGATQYLYTGLVPDLAGAQSAFAMVFGKAISNGNCASLFWRHVADGSASNYCELSIWGTSTLQVFSDRVNIPSTTASTSTITGALTVAGGIGAAGQIYSAGFRAVTVGNGSIGFQSFVPAISAGQYHLGLTMGKQSGVNNDSGSILWYHTGDGSTSNYMYFSLWGGSLFKFFNDHALFEPTTASTSQTTGALVVSGGLGVGGSIFSGNITVLTTNGTISLENNGAGAARRTCYMQWDQTNSRGVIGTWNAATSNPDYPIHIISNNASTSVTTGALVMAGGLGVGGSIFANSVSSRMSANGAIHFTALNTSLGDGEYIVGLLGGHAASNYNCYVVEFHNVANNSTSNHLSMNVLGGSAVAIHTDRLAIEATTASTSSITGSLVTAGGCGIAGDLYVGGTIHGAAVVAESTTSVNNSWTNITSANLLFQFRKIGNLVTLFYPNMSAKTFAAGGPYTVISFGATVPAGFRPVSDCTMVIMTPISGTNKFTLFTVDASGNIQIAPLSSTWATGETITIYAGAMTYSIANV